MFRDVAGRGSPTVLVGTRAESVVPGGAKSDAERAPVAGGWPSVPWLWWER